jgi:hypothetical protein
MSTWEERMTARAAERASHARAEERAAATTDDWHLHGTLTACPCGAETGITTVAFPDGWMQPDPCPGCGKPVSGFGNTYPWRHVKAHALGCREHPETRRCDACGQPMIGELLYDGTGIYHFACAPGARRIG